MFFKVIKNLFSDVYFIVLLLIFIFLIIFKSSYLSLPYFSDELWVYGPAIRKMGTQLPSLLPNSLSVNDHWGHPMFFFFLGGLWCNIFGASLISTHIFATTISISLLFIIYLIVKNLFNKSIAFFSVLTLIFQSIFIGLFTLVLPEILLTIFVFLTLFFFIKDKKIPYLICGSFLVLIKETGVLLIFSILLWHIVKSIFYNNEKAFNWYFIKESMIIILPITFLLLHVLTLKLNYNWFVMPERIDDFNFKWDTYYKRITNSFYYIFVNQGRKPIIIVLFLISILLNTKYTLRNRFLILIISFSIFKIFFNYWDLPTFIDVTIVPFIFLYIIKIIIIDIYKINKQKGTFLSVSTIFILIYILFTSAQFDSLRYLFCLIPFFIIIFYYFVDNNIIYIKKISLALLCFTCIIFSILYIIDDKNFGDDTLNYSDVCKVNKSMITFLENKKFYNDSIKCSFLIQHSLQRPLTGYLSSNKTFKNVSPLSQNFDVNNSNLLIFDSSHPNDLYSNIINNPNFNLIFQEKIGVAWVEVYKKNDYSLKLKNYDLRNNRDSRW